MDHDVTVAKPKGTFRIFYVGDSFIQGTVPMDQSVPSRVQQALEPAFRSRGRSLEVVNTGTWSYSPTIYYVLLRYYLLDYTPDLVVLPVDMTADYDDWKYAFSVVNDPEGKPYAVPPRQLEASMFVDTRDGAVEATWNLKLHMFLFQSSYFY